MPCGGGDIGMNVWMENGDVLFYLSRSGSFDENNTLLKAGRFRVSLSPNIDTSRFRQVLHLAEGYVELTDGVISVQLWADVYKPVVHVDVKSKGKKLNVAVTYENWRTRDITMTKREVFQSSYKFDAPDGLQTHRDSILATSRALTFMHNNGEKTIFDATVSQQKMDAVKDKLANPLKNLVFGGRMKGDGFVLMDQMSGRYVSTDYQGWIYVTERPRRNSHLQIVMATRQGTVSEWLAELTSTEGKINYKKDRKNTRLWWQQFWQRSYVEASGEAASLARNYTLFRYMLGCNAHGQWPTKFNGGLFTFDPEYVAQADEYKLSPDYRNWGGGVHTSQNQRLVYWPMLKNGDFDALKAQLDFYLYIYKNAEERSRLYWGHEGASITEQVENYGLPCYAEYGQKRPEGFDPGMQRNAWLEYEWDTCLEFCMMALEAHRYQNIDVSAYVPMIYSCLRFFDEHYQYLANMRGAKRLNSDGKLVLYPGSGAETFKGAYNSTSTIAALRTVTQALIDYEKGVGHAAVSGAKGNNTVAYLEGLMTRLPDITVRDGMIQPALLWERVQNTEPTQLYPVFPWRMYGVGRPDIDIARNTYTNDSLAVKFRSHVGWKQDVIWAACLGLTDEAARLLKLKIGDGPYRFPAWPKQWDLKFKLYASQGTIVEAEMKDGKVVNVKVTPEERMKDVVY